MRIARRVSHTALQAVCADVRVLKHRKDYLDLQESVQVGPQFSSAVLNR